MGLRYPGTSPGRLNRTKITMSVNAYHKTACDACRGRIEYPIDLAGHLVACPHCGHLTRLAVLPAASKPVSETTAQLRDRMRRDSGYREFRSVIAVIHATLLIAAGLILIFGLWLWHEPSIAFSQRETTIFCALLFATGSLLVLGATIFKMSLTLLVDIADAILHASRRIAPR